MAGAFTHFLVCDQAKTKRSILGKDLWQLLNRHYGFLFLGAASPDLPYLSFKTGEVNWADLMHYENTNGIAIAGHNLLKEKWTSGSPTYEASFVWLLGYISHLVTDATIHPVVQSIVGCYEENKTEHRLCEMMQDSLLYSLSRKGDIRYAEFSSMLKFCKQSGQFDDVLGFWRDLLLQTYSLNEKPDPASWFKTYTAAIDLAEGGSSIVALFRHAGVGASLIYKTKSEIEDKYAEDSKKYFSAVNLPNGGVGTFTKEGFLRSIENVVDVWKRLYAGLTSDILVTDIIRNWDLDTGIDMDSDDIPVTYWV